MAKNTIKNATVPSSTIEPVEPTTDIVEAPIEPATDIVEVEPEAPAPVEATVEPPSAPALDVTAIMAMMGQMAQTVAALAATVENIKAVSAPAPAPAPTQTPTQTQTQTGTDSDPDPDSEKEEEGVQVTWAQVRSIARRLMNFAGNEPLHNWIPGLTAHQKPSTQEGWRAYYQEGADRLTDLGVSRAGLNRAFAALKDNPTGIKARRNMLRGLYEVLGEDFKALPLWGAEAEEAAPAAKKGGAKGKESSSGDEASFLKEVRAKIAAARARGDHKAAMELLAMLG